MTSPRDEAFLRDLAELKLHHIAETYQEVLNEAARKGSSIIDVLALLIGEEADCRRQLALERRVHNARLPKRKLLEDYDFNFPEKIPKQAILRLFDCDFVAEHGCAVFIGVDNTLATAMIDRLMHHGEAIVIQADSYRMKDKGSDEKPT